MAAPLAAAIHLGYLPPKVRTEEELSWLLKQKIPFRQGTPAREFGILHHLGRGRKAEDVFILAVGKKPDLVLKTITKMLPLIGEDLANYRFIDCEVDLNQDGATGAEEGTGLYRWYNALGRLVVRVQKEL